MGERRGSLVLVGVGVVVIIVGAVFAVLGLDKGDQIASGLGAGAAVVGVLVSWLCRPRKDGQTGKSADGRRSDGVSVHNEAHDNGRVYQVVEGDMTIGEE